MSQTQWKKFIKFFDPQAAIPGAQGRSGSEDPDKQLNNILETSEKKFVENILGLFYIGVPSGKILVCVGDQTKFTSQAHTHNLFYMSKSRKHPILITIGLDEFEYNNRKGLVKIWDVSDPQFMREMTNIILPDTTAMNVVSFAMTEDMTKMALGLSTGQIYYIYGTILQGGKTVNKRFIANEKKASITNLFFFNKGSSYYLFYTTTESVGSYFLKEKGEVHNLLEDSDGCEHLCADLDEKKERLVVAMYNLNAIAIFLPEFKGQTWSIEGQKAIIKCVHNQVLVVTSNKNQQQVTIYDIDNKLISFQSNYSQIDHILCEEDGVFIISKNNKKEVIIQKLIEKDTNEKLKILINKNAYDIAYNMARSEGYEESFIAEISKMQGDHYYSKEDFDNAINCYKQTVGFLEASYVIIQFLDASKIEFLTSYLETLHSKHQANNEHTALLLNCYVHLKKTDELAKFLAQSNDDYELFDPKTAIDVCCSVNCYGLALSLASKHKMHSLFIKIRIEEEKKYLEALQYIENNMSTSGFAKIFKEFGQILMKNEPVKTKELVFKIVKSLNLKMGLNVFLPETDKDEKPQKDAEEDDYSLEEVKKKPITVTSYQVLESVMSGLVNHPDILDDLLTDITRTTPDIENLVYHKLFELYLQQRKPLKDSESSKLIPASKTGSRDLQYYERKIKELLEIANNKYDKHHVLMLFKMYDYAEGVVAISHLMDSKQELMFHYIKTNDHGNIWNTCNKYGQDDNDLWVQALTHFCTKDDTKCIIYIDRILQEIEQKDFLTPLIVLKILSKSKNITFGTVKNYLKKQLGKHQVIMKNDQEEYERNAQNIKQKKNDIYELKTQARKFQFNKCSGCEGKLSLTSVHFMCLHSYHIGCLTDNTHECQHCAEQATRAFERRSEYNKQSMNHGNFFKELSDSNDRFGTIAKYFGRGLFSNKI
jgi:vacuolar protein sorting-associated protein 11